MLLCVFVSHSMMRQFPLGAFACAILFCCFGLFLCHFVVKYVDDCVLCLGVMVQKLPVADLQCGPGTASLKTIENEYNDAHTVFSSKAQQARSWTVELQSWLRSRLPPAEAHDSAEMVAYRGWAETKADLAMMHMLHNATEGRLAVRVRTEC